ncbi:MAG: hypothetical protein AAF297_00330 [Planctomycetota bacterium]
MEAFFSPFSVAIVAIVMVFGCGMVSIIGNTLRKIAVRRAQEESRREVAAYVAEGSMTADEGERLLKAAPPNTDDDD